jgi:hypothetical protein
VRYCCTVLARASNNATSKRACSVLVTPHLPRVLPRAAGFVHPRGRVPGVTDSESASCRARALTAWLVLTVALHSSCIWRIATGWSAQDRTPPPGGGTTSTCRP